MTARLAPSFERQAAPRAAHGVWPSAGGVRWLLDHAASLSDRLTELNGQATERGVLLVGETAQLPWAPGAQYVAPCSDSLLWLPVRDVPDLPARWVAAAMQRLAATHAPVLCLPRSGCLVPFDALGPVGVEQLGKWLQRRPHEQAARSETPSRPGILSRASGPVRHRPRHPARALDPEAG